MASSFGLSSFGLPRFVLLKANNDKFVRQTNEYVEGSLRYTGEDITSQYIKFEMEMAKTGDGSLFHIRSCSNNKYWRMESTYSLYFTAAADKPNEDRSQWSCTLFEPVRAEEGGSNDKLIIRLICVHNQMLVAVVAVGGPSDRNYTLYPMLNEAYRTEFTVIDAESILILPKTIAFKASHGKYVSSLDDDGGGPVGALQTDIGLPSCAFGITYNSDGYARITCNSNGYAMVGSNALFLPLPVMLLPLTDLPSLEDKNALFKLIKVAGPEKNKDGKMVGRTTIALRCVANNMFVRHDPDVLYADQSSITPEAVFTIEEPVLSRSIFNVRFRPADSRIYDQTIVSMATQDVSNYGTQPQVEHLTLKYEQSSSSTFDRSVSLSVGVKTTFKTGIPFIAEGEIDFSVDVEGSMGWSDTDEKSQAVESTQDVTVDPMTRVVASVIATKGKCDVPFSYTQRDILFDGTDVVTEMEDGIYRGVYSWNFHSETTSQPLQPKH